MFDLQMSSNVINDNARENKTIVLWLTKSLYIFFKLDTFNGWSISIEDLEWHLAITKENKPFSFIQK